MRAVVGPLLLAAVGTAACSDSDLASDVEVGWYGNLSGESPPAIDVPATATAGTPFIVSLYTSGNGCGDSVSTDVTPTSDGALVVPYDRYGEPCVLAIAADYKHAAELMFATPGTYTILLRFRGCFKLPQCASRLYDHAFSVAVQ